LRGEVREETQHSAREKQAGSCLGRARVEPVAGEGERARRFATKKKGGPGAQGSMGLMDRANGGNIKTNS